MKREKLAMVAIAVPNLDQNDDDLQLYRVKDAMRLLKLSRTVIYAITSSSWKTRPGRKQDGDDSTQGTR
jgi:hypothetical protein